MPRGNSFNWHVESLRKDLAEILLSMDVGDCFTGTTLAELLHRTKNSHARKSGTKRLIPQRNRRIGAYMEGKRYFAKIAKGLAENSDEINFITRYIRKGCIEKEDVLGYEISGQYYQIVQWLHLDMKQNDNDFDDALYDFKIRMLELLSNAAPWIVMIVVIYIITLIAAWNMALDD